MTKNAAYRIATTFEKLRPIKDQNLLLGWAEVFGVPVGSVSYMQALLGLNADFERFQFELELAEASDRAKALYSKASAKLSPYVSMGTLHSHTVKQVNANGDSVDLMYLAADVTKGLSSQAVNPLTLETIGKDLSQLSASLDQADIDERLRRFLKFQIGNMLQALSAFDVIGIEGLSRIYGATASEIARAGGLKEAQRPSVRAWLVKAQSVFRLIGAGVVWAGAVSGGADAAIEHGTHLLEFVGVVTAEDQAAANTP